MTDILDNGRMAENVTTFVTSATPLTLVATSGPYVRFTGTADQKVSMPVPSSLFIGQRFVLMNRSAGNLSVYENNGTTFIGMVYAGKEAVLTLLSSGGAYDITKSGDSDVTEPLKLTASTPPTSVLTIAPSITTTDDGAGKAASAIDGAVISTSAITIDFQAGGISGGVVLNGVNGPTLTMPYTVVGEFRRIVFAAQKDESITASFSSAQAVFGNLTNAGDLLAPLNGLAVGYVDLEATVGFISHTFLPGVVDTTNNLITIVGHGLAEDQAVSFSSTGTLPSPLVAATNYYVLNATTDDFQVSTSIGGSPVDFTTQGTGTHTVTIHSFKTAGSTLSVIENEVGGIPTIVRFGSGGGGSLNLKDGGVETKVETTETTYSIDSGKVNMHPFMHVLTGHILTVPSGARLLSTDDTIDGTVIVSAGGIWKVL